MLSGVPGGDFPQGHRQRHFSWPPFSFRGLHPNPTINGRQLELWSLVWSIDLMVCCGQNLTAVLSALSPAPWQGECLSLLCASGAAREKVVHLRVGNHKIPGEASSEGIDCNDALCLETVVNCQVEGPRVELPEGRLGRRDHHAAGCARLYPLSPLVQVTGPRTDVSP